MQCVQLYIDEVEILKLLCIPSPCQWFENGVVAERVGDKGIIFYVSTDSAAGHGLSDFVESFQADNECRFSLETREQFKQVKSDIKRIFSQA